MALFHDGSSVIINKDGPCYVYDIMEEREFLASLGKAVPNSPYVARAK